MKKRGYGQYCGFARALEIVGERWALLIIRDLLVGPRRFTDLRRGLPRIPTNILAERLKELEHAGVVRRRALPRPSGSIVYELTERGRGLDDIVLGLGRWGAGSLGDPRPGEIVTPDSLVMALRTAFRPRAAGTLRADFEIRLGEIVVHARVHEGTLEAGAGPLPGPDLVIETGPALRALMAGEIGVAEAIEEGLVHLCGDQDLLPMFVEVFHIDPSPVPLPSETGATLSAGRGGSIAAPADD
jgi:DNA-binding HxlR family transcriptional regulator